MVRTLKTVTGTSGTPRRQHERSFKAELVARCLVPEASVAAVALAGGGNANVMFNCRRDHLRAMRPSGAASSSAVSVPVGRRSGTRMWLAAGVTDMRCAIDSLAVKVQTVLAADPCAGHLYAFHGHRGDLLKLLQGDGMCLLTKRPERGRFVWPQAEFGSVSLSTAELSMLLA